MTPTIEEIARTISLAAWEYDYTPRDPKYPDVRWVEAMDAAKAVIEKYIAPALSACEGAMVALEELLVAVEYGGVADLNSNPDNPGYTPRIPIAFVTSARSAIAQLQKVVG